MRYLDSSTNPDTFHQTQRDGKVTKIHPIARRSAFPAGCRQWMAGGMTMVGDMFNHGLQATVSGLASDLSSLLTSTPVYVPAPARPGSPGRSAG